MTFSFFAGRSTLARIHQTVQRNILRQHRQQHGNPASSSPKTSADPNVSPRSPPKGSGIPGPSWSWVEPVLTPFRAYGNMQKRRPMLTQFEASIIVYFCGDLSAQMMSTTAFADGPYEPVRSLRAMLIGGISSIPSYKWFLFLGRSFNYGSGQVGHWFSIAVKIAINQTFFTPIFNTYFFGMQSLLSGASWEQTKRRVVETVPVSWKNSWKVWPAVTAFSFTFIRPQNRSIFAGVIAVFWQMYLSWLNKRAEDNEGGKSRTEMLVDEKVEQKVGKAKKKAKKALEDVKV